MKPVTKTSQDESLHFSLPPYNTVLEGTIHPNPAPIIFSVMEALPAQNLSEQTFMLTTNSLVSQNYRGENILFFYMKEASKQELQKMQVQRFKVTVEDRVPCPQLCQTKNDTACFCNCQPHVVKSNKLYWIFFYSFLWTIWNLINYSTITS